MIDINKRYCTKSGHEVRIYATDGGGDYPVHGAVLEKNYWRILSWDENGNLKSDQGQPYDIVEFKPRIKRSLWVNIYPQGGSCDFLHDSKNEADENAGDRRIACVKVEIDCEEGEGL